MSHNWKRGAGLGRTRIAQKLLERMKRQAPGDVVNREDVVSAKDLASMHPAHAAYVYTQNQVSVMVEQLTALPEMAEFVDIISEPQDLLAIQAELFTRGKRDERS